MKFGSFGSSRGGTKIWIGLFVVGVVVVYIVFFKFGPVYQEKWGLEDAMQDLMNRYVVFSANSEEPEYDMLIELQKYTQNHGLPFDPLEDMGQGEYRCTIVAEVSKPGKIVCPYTVKIYFPGYMYTMPVEAKYETHRVPSQSF